MIPWQTDSSSDDYSFKQVYSKTDWGGRWEGVQNGEHMCTRGRFMLMYDKTSTIL